ncbi:hypothetical protein E2C01_084034 [Portunus trituberculatus]|uniref:Uncharacterized protein n=1 Tax=Portunus trituberculatus TaxID=210409 RepID=A0A5B7IYV1_PORTR|nr:hypothetical protein [Portunus trituberculatus]
MVKSLWSVVENPVGRMSSEQVFKQCYVVITSSRAHTMPHAAPHDAEFKEGRRGKHSRYTGHWPDVCE